MTAPLPIDEADRKAIVAAVAENFDAETSFLADFVRIPSQRFEEGPAQDFIAAALRARGYEVDDWKIELDDLKDLKGFGPIEGDFSRARTVVGSHRPDVVKGRSLILQGHLDVVPVGPLEMWETPPYEPAIKDGWMNGRGAGDMKAGTVCALFALDALRSAGFEPAAPVFFQSVIEEESTGLGALSTLQRGYRADAALLPEPTGHRFSNAQVGVLWFKLKVRGKPVHVSVAGEGSNAIMASFEVLKKLSALQEEWNARKGDDPVWKDVPHPLNFNAGKIQGGDWASSVPAWCDVDCRIGVLPGFDLDKCKQEIVDCVAAAARENPFLANNPPEVVWNGFQAEGWVLENGEELHEVLSTAYSDVFEGEMMELRSSTALTDTRFYELYYDIPAVCFGPKALNVHGFDEKVELASMQKVTETIALFIARWCGLNKIEAA